MDSALLNIPLLIFACGMLIKIERRLSRLELLCPHIKDKDQVSLSGPGGF